MNQFFKSMKKVQKSIKTHFFCQIGVATFLVAIQIGPPITQNFCNGSAKVYEIKIKMCSQKWWLVTDVSVTLTEWLTDFPNSDIVHEQCYDAVCKRSEKHSSDAVHDDRVLVSLHHFYHCINSFAANVR